MAPYLLFVALLASSPSSAPPASLVVDAGVYPVAGAEIFVEGFSIDAHTTPWPNTGGFSREDECHLPTPDEWLAAATLPRFEVAPAYEFVKSPWTTDCDMSRADQEAMVDAEGVIFETQYYASGPMPDGGNGPGRIVAGKGQDSLAGDPSPRAYRCVTRAAYRPKQRYVEASGINLRAGRSATYPILDGATIGTPVGELYSGDGWSFVEVKLRRNECDYQGRGWVKAEFLGDERPDRGALLKNGKAQLEARQFAQAAQQLERAYVLKKDDMATRDLLLQAYDKAGMSVEAKKLRAEGKKQHLRK